MSYCVYKHTFPNGKVYIGITCQKPEKRWRCGYGYLDKNKNGKYAQSRMAHAILKYGWDNVEHEIIWTELTKEEAEQKEIEFISKYKSNNSKFGYNSDNGGNTVGKLSEETKRKMSESRKGSRISEETKLKIINNSPKKKRVLCVETDVVYTSIGDAYRATDISVSKISAVCNKKKNTAGGYHWKFIDKKDVDNISKKNIEKNNKKNNGATGKEKPVRCVETQVIYDSQLKASEQTGIEKGSIGKCCRCERKTAGGYHWEFVTENEN